MGKEEPVWEIPWYRGLRGPPSHTGYGSLSISNLTPKGEVQHVLDMEREPYDLTRITCIILWYGRPRIHLLTLPVPYRVPIQ